MVNEEGYEQQSRIDNDNIDEDGDGHCRSGSHADVEISSNARRALHRSVRVMKG